MHCYWLGHPVHKADPDNKTASLICRVTLQITTLILLFTGSPYQHHIVSYVQGHPANNKRFFSYVQGDPANKNACSLYMQGDPVSNSAYTVRCRVTLPISDKDTCWFMYRVTRSIVTSLFKIWFSSVSSASRQRVTSLALQNMRGTKCPLSPTLQNMGGGTCPPPKQSPWSCQ